jgi:hypothetical protein
MTAKYLHLEFEGNAIYLHKEDEEHGLSKNGFWVDFSDTLKKKKNIKEYSDRYVIILGTFNMKSKGHMGMFGGTFENIIRLDTWGK